MGAMVGAATGVLGHDDFEIALPLIARFEGFGHGFGVFIGEVVRRRFREL
jgi:hypothetical protein